MRWNVSLNTLTNPYYGKLYADFGGWSKWYSDMHRPGAGGADQNAGQPPAPASGDGSSGAGGTTPPATGGTTAGGTTLPATGGNDFAHQLLDLTNAFRAEHGVASLAWDDKLALAAQQHSQDMASKHYFSHTQPDGDTLTDRLEEVGYHYSSAGENIAMGQQTPEAVMQAWEDSPGHRANLLNPSFTEFGAGYVDAAQDLWTQNFGSEFA